MKRLSYVTSQLAAAAILWRHNFCAAPLTSSSLIATLEHAHAWHVNLPLASNRLWPHLISSICIVSLSIINLILFRFGTRTLKLILTHFFLSLFFPSTFLPPMYTYPINTWSPESVVHLPVALHRCNTYILLLCYTFYYTIFFSSLLVVCIVPNYCLIMLYGWAKRVAKF